MDKAARALPFKLLKRTVCLSCLRQMRREAFHTNSRLRDSRPKSYIARPGEQANPIAGYYAELLDQPLHTAASATPTPATPPPTPTPQTEREERIGKARLVFGSRLAGPIERRKQIDAQSTTVAGIVVPPRPGEPENCCMSGCVNCVWDQYRDELEEWAAQSTLAREALARQNRKASSKSSKKQIPTAGTGSMVAQAGAPAHVAVSMDDDGGGSDTNWNLGDEPPGKGEDLFRGIPVGIREFMKTEKKLRDRHRAERAAAS